MPVSLAVLLDVSDSMVGLRLTDARQALDRFLFELLSRDDEYALVVFNHQPTIAAPWTDDPAKVTPALDALRGWGGTAIYDAVNASLPLLDRRHRQRGAAVVISDGSDTASDIQVRDLRSRLLRTDAFVYAIGIDRDDPRALRTRINPYSLRQITDDTGGYTEVVKDTNELGPATGRIADELNKQYTLGYTPAHGRRQPVPRHPRTRQARRLSGACQARIYCDARPQAALVTRQSQRHEDTKTHRRVLGRTKKSPCVFVTLCLCG